MAVSLETVITLSLYATVTGSTEAPALEGFQIAIGSLLSSAGGLRGNFESPSFHGLFGAASSTLGTIQRLDADGDLDVGSNSPSLNSNFIGGHSPSMTTGNANGLGVSEFLFYSVNFRITQTIAPGCLLARRKR